MNRTLLALALSLVSPIACAEMGVAQDKGTPDPPGELVDLGGRRLHQLCAGRGSPAVVIENGNGGFSIDWALVQPEVARFTRVCAYDRAGCAWSDDGPTRGTVEETVDDLHLLLRKTGVSPPYVLVGASIGGMYVRAYQRRFPGEVSGLVFVDSTHEDGLEFLVDGKSRAIHLMSGEEMRAAFAPLLQTPPAPPEGPTTLEPPFDRLPKRLQPARLWAARKFFAGLDIYEGMISSQSWRQEFIAQRRQRLSTAHALGDLPLVVMGRTNDNAEKRRKQQEELTGLSSAGKLVLAEKSGHEIHLDRPELVVQAIRDVVTAAREKAPRADQH